MRCRTVITLVAGAALTISVVAPPTNPQAFELTLTCTEAAPVTVTFTTVTTAAQTLAVTAPAARADGASIDVSCTWSGVGAVFAQELVALPSDFNFVVVASVVVSTFATRTQLNATTPTSVVTVSVPAGTVFSSSIGIMMRCSCLPDIIVVQQWHMLHVDVGSLQLQDVACPRDRCKELN